MKIKTLIWILLIGISFVACKKEVPQPTPTPYEVNMNPKSNHIMRANHEDGTVVNYFGKKDEVGKTKQIQLVSIQGTDETQPDLLYFNEESQLSRIHAADGAQYQFEWLSETTFRLIATSADKSEQVSIPVDLDEIGLQKPVNDIAGSTNIPISSSVSKAQRSGRAKFEVHLQKQEELNTTISGRDNNRTVFIDLTRCGETIPIEEYSNYPISLDFLSVIDFESYILPEGNSNQYILPEYGLPGTVADLSEICGSISTALGYMCTILGPVASSDVLTTTICAALATYTINPGAFVLCERTFTLIGRVCILAGSPEIGIPSITDELCGLVGELEATFTPDYIRLGLYGYPNANYVDVPYEGPFGTITLEIPNAEAAIENLAINPVDPAPGEYYLATANIHCAEGKLVSISIVGTDGYTDANAFIAQGNITVYLWVPGAEYGIQDLITVEVEDGPKMVTSIVF